MYSGSGSNEITKLQIRDKLLGFRHNMYVKLPREYQFASSITTLNSRLKWYFVLCCRIYGLMV